MLEQCCSRPPSVNTLVLSAMLPSSQDNADALSDALDVMSEALDKAGGALGPGGCFFGRFLEFGARGWWQGRACDRPAAGFEWEIVCAAFGRCLMWVQGFLMDMTTHATLVPYGTATIAFLFMLTMSNILGPFDRIDEETTYRSFRTGSVAVFLCKRPSSALSLPSAIRYTEVVHLSIAQGAVQRPYL
jgi:hypothetical protein